MNFTRRRISFASRTRRSATQLHVESLESRRVLATISGQVVNDLNGNGAINAGEPGQAGVQVYIDANNNDVLDIVGSSVDPDSFASGAAITATGMTFQVVDAANAQVTPAPVVMAVAPLFQSTGSLVFGRDGESIWHDQRRLRVNFATPIKGVALDFIGGRLGATEVGVLQAFDSANQKIGEDLTGEVLPNEYQTMEIQLEDPEIAYIIAYTEKPGAAGRLDSLRINSQGSEVWTITDASGNYDFQNLAAGTYRINEVVPTGFTQTLPSTGNGSQSVTVTANETKSGIQFANVGQATSSWHNDAMPMDVSGDGVIVPRDVLLIINELNQPAFHDETGKLATPPAEVPAFFDVDDDGFVTPNDAILIINFLNQQPAAAVAASNQSSDLGMASIAVGEPNGSDAEEASSDAAMAILSADTDDDDAPAAKPVEMGPLTVDALFALE